MDITKVDSIIETWNHDSDYVIEMLQDVQDEYRYLPEDVIRYIADELSVPQGRLYHISTFFKAFSLVPRGKYPIQVCTGTACHVKGSQRVIERIETELGISQGETTEDQLFSLEGVRCLGCCSLAPVVVVGDDVQGFVEPSKTPKLIKKYSEGEK